MSKSIGKILGMNGWPSIRQLRIVLQGMIATAALGGCFSPYYRAVDEWAMSDRELLALRLSESDKALEEAAEQTRNAAAAVRKTERSGGSHEEAGRVEIEAADLAVHRVKQKLAIARETLQQRATDEAAVQPQILQAGEALAQIEASAERLGEIVTALGQAASSSLTDEMRQLQQTIKAQRRAHHKVIHALRASEP